MQKEIIKACLKWEGFTDDDFYTYKNMRFLRWEQDRDQELYYGVRENGHLHSVFWHELNLPTGNTHPLQWLLCGESSREQLKEHHKDPDALIHDILHHDVPIPVDCGGVSDSIWKNLKDMETMRIWINFPVIRRIISNRARCLFYSSPYKNRLLDEYSLNWLKKAMQIYAKVAKDPIYQEVLDKYNWNGDNIITMDKVKKARNRSLQRFINAQDYGSIYDNTSTYAKAMEELRNGVKETHWMWYVFPQMKGLGHSEISDFYGIEDRDEAYDYMENPILSGRLIEATEAVLNSSHSAYGIFGEDVIKFRSCMLLFSTISDNPVFKKVLNKYCWN